MAHCVLCATAITEDTQYYMTCNIGLEISTFIDQNLGHDIEENGLICAQCFENIVQDFARMSPSNIKQELDTLPPVTNVCVYCQTSLFNRRCEMVGEGSQREFISERISPRTIPDGSRVCYACWTYIQNSLKAQGIISTPPANTNICVCCQVSLARRRRHSIPEGPERDEIVQRIQPREIPPGGLVCYACWVSARRNVQRVHNCNIETEESIEPGPSHSHYKNVCVWCGVSLFRQYTHILTGPERDKVAAKIYPSEMPPHAFACSNCFARAQELIQIEQGHVIEVGTNNPLISLENFSRTTSSSGHCFVPGCHNSERHIVPHYLRKIILNTQKVFVTANARICAEHKCVYNWEFLDKHQFSNTFTKLELESMLNLSIQEFECNMDFEKFELINDPLFKYWTGVEKEKYVQMLNVINPAFGSREKPKTALGIYLIKVRTGDTHERISSLLAISKSTVTRLLEKAREALESLFVPLQINHITEELN